MVSHKIMERSEKSLEEKIDETRKYLEEVKTTGEERHAYNKNRLETELQQFTRDLETFIEKNGEEEDAQIEVYENLKDEGEDLIETLKFEIETKKRQKEEKEKRLQIEEKEKERRLEIEKEKEKRFQMEQRDEERKRKFEKEKLRIQTRIELEKIKLEKFKIEMKICMEEQEQKLRGKEDKEQELLRERERKEQEMEIERLKNLIEEKEKSFEELQKPDWNDEQKIKINRKNDESIHGNNNDNDDEDDGDRNHDSNDDIDIVISSENEKDSRTDDVEHENSRRDALEQNESESLFQSTKDFNDNVELCEVVSPKSGLTTPNRKRTSDGNFSEKILIRLEDLERTTERRTINDPESRTPTVASGRRSYSKERLQKTTDCVHNDMPTNATRVCKPTEKQQRKLLRKLTELEPTEKIQKDIEEWNIKKDSNDRYLKRKKNKRKQRDPYVKELIGPMRQSSVLGVS